MVGGMLAGAAHAAGGYHSPGGAAVHQACEGILEAMLVELNRVEAALFKADYAAAERHVLTACRFMRPFELTVSMLGEMSQLDYAPLRVALRDASGIQSARATARKEVVKDHFWLFRQQLKHRGLDCLVVLANPVEFAREYRLLQAFKTLGKAINGSMSHHAHLVTNTLGSTVIGTVGFRILSLGKIAAMPLLRDLTKALDQLTLWTALRYADHSGIVIHEQEREHGAAGKYESALPAAPCDPALMTATTARYFDAIRDHAKDDWKALFSESPHFEDPRGTKPYVSEFQPRRVLPQLPEAVPDGAVGRAHGRRAGRQPPEGGVAHRGRVLPAGDGGALRRHRDVPLRSRRAHPRRVRRLEPGRAGRGDDAAPSRRHCRPEDAGGEAADGERRASGGVQVNAPAGRASRAGGVPAVGRTRVGNATGSTSAGTPGGTSWAAERAGRVPGTAPRREAGRGARAGATAPVTTTCRFADEGATPALGDAQPLRGAAGPEDRGPVAQ